MLRPLRLLAWLLPLIVVGAPLAAVALFLLAITGSPGSCEDEERPISHSEELAASFQETWDQLNATLDAGQVSTVIFDEGEATSRARRWVEEHDVPVSQLFLCFSADGGSASGKVDVPFFPGDIDVVIRGTLDLRGEHPEAVIEEIEVGRLPGPFTSLVKGFVDELIDDQTEGLELHHDYGMTFGEGELTISGQP